MKKYLIGIVIGFVLALSTNTFAAVVDKVEATFSYFNFVINGVEKEIETPVLVHNGFSYISTRHIAQLFDADITYKADNRTIGIDLPEPIVAVDEQEPIPITKEPGESLPEPVRAPEQTVEQPKTTTPEPEPKTEPEPQPVDNAAVCQGIHQDYNVSMAELRYEQLADGPRRQKVLVIEYNRDQALAAAGCN